MNRKNEPVDEVQGQGSGHPEPMEISPEQLSKILDEHLKWLESGSFDGPLKRIEEASKNSRKLFFILLLGCAYALLTIITTTDVLLLTNAASSPLPIIGTNIPIVGFYFVAPLILLGLYFYFHLYLQRLWEGLAELPAVFPDGVTLDKKAYPWLLISMVRVHLSELNEDRPPLSYLQKWTSILLAWVFVPATLICFWLRYLPRQDWIGTVLHIVLLVVAIWTAIMFYRLGIATLRKDEPELSLWKKPFKEKKTYRLGAVVIGIGLIVLLLSLGSINGAKSDKFQFDKAGTWVPFFFGQIGFSPFANFAEKEISTKPSNWSGKKEEIPQVKGAPLKRRKLRYAQAIRAFLVNADLRWADLQEANLEEANLQGANLQGANLSRADLYKASLQEANLQGANLQGAVLREANLNGAKLQGAILYNANLTLADLTKANLTAANIQGIDLTKTRGLTKDQIGWALTDKETQLPNYLKLRSK